MQTIPISPVAMVRSLTKNRSLIYQMSKREVIGRYKGSAMGLLWSFFNPILMLIVYTFVFGVIFKARWPGVTNNLEFTGILFSGLIVYSLFSECVSRVPSLILSNVNYVKKVVFPLEILPWIALGSTLFHAIGIIMMAMMFVSPIFYPASAFPGSYHIFFYLNSMTFIIEQSREVLLWGHMPNWEGLGIYFSVSVFVAWLGFAWFQKTRRGFADVL